MYLQILDKLLTKLNEMMKANDFDRALYIVSVQQSFLNLLNFYGLKVWELPVEGFDSNYMFIFLTMGHAINYCWDLENQNLRSF